MGTVITADAAPTDESAPQEPTQSRPDSPKRRFAGEISAQVREMAGVVRWVIAAASSSRPQMLRIVVLDLVSLLGWLAALAGFLGLVRCLESGSAFRMGPLEISLAGGSQTTFAICVALAAIGGFGACTHFIARRQSAAVAGQLVIELRERILRVIDGSAGQQWRTSVDGRLNKFLRKLTAKGPISASLALWSLLKSLLPSGIVVAAGIYLVTVDAVLSLLLVPLLVPYLVALSLAYARVAQSRRSYVEVSDGAVSDIIDSFTAVASNEVPESWDITHAERALQAPEHGKSVQLFFELRLVMQRVRMINGVFTVVCIAAVLMFFVPLIQVTERSWADPIVFIVGLRLMLLAAQRTSGGLAMVSRRIPEIAILSRFLDASESAAGFASAGAQSDSPFSSSPEDLELEGDL